MKKGGTRVDPPKPSNNTKLKDGDTIECTHATSCGYTKGKQYRVYKNDKGWICTKGDDGLEDICSMVISTFRKVDHEHKPNIQPV